MRITTLVAVILINSPAVDLSERCVVIRQVGPIWNATDEEMKQGIEFPCRMDFYEALDQYRREMRRRANEECPRCYPNGDTWHQ